MRTIQAQISVPLRAVGSGSALPAQGNWLNFVQCLPFLQGIQPMRFPVCFFCIPSSFWKGVYSNRKEFAPLGSKFFPLRVNPFSNKRRPNTFGRVASSESLSIPFKELLNEKSEDNQEIPQSRITAFPRHQKKGR